MRLMIGISTAALLAACSSNIIDGNRDEPSATTFKVVNVALQDQDAIPAGATIPDDAASKFNSVIEFNDAVDENTLVSGLTVKYRYNNVPVDGMFEVIPPDDRRVVFFSDQKLSDIAPNCPDGGNISRVIIHGREGPIFDDQGQQWPFSGVHAAHPLSGPVTLGPLLDGDADGEPGGDFETGMRVTC